MRIAPDLGMGAMPPAYIPIGLALATSDFSFATLAATINSVPFTPSLLGDWGIFEYTGALTRDIEVEFDAQSINIIPTSAANSPGLSVGLAARTTQSFKAPRLAETVTVKASEVASIRKLGSVQLESVETNVDRKIKNAVRNMRSTMEYHRVGAACGRVLDADGSTIFNFYTASGVSEPTYDFTWATGGSVLNVKCKQILDKVEDALGEFTTGAQVYAIVGRTFWEKLMSDSSFSDAYKYFESQKQAVLPLREDLRYADFEFGGIIWRQYRGKNGSTPFVADAEGRIIVDVPGSYLGLFAPPQDMMGKVDEPGEPFYVTVKILDHDAGLEIRMQSNPFHIGTRPGAQIKLYSSN